MAVIKVLVLIGIVAVTSAKIKTEPECGNIRPGRYCNKDLSGFKICGERGEVERASCDAHYRCPCGFNRRCERDDECIERPKFEPSQIPSDFTVSFNGRRTFSFPTGFRDENLNGYIRQDTTPGDEKFSMLTTFTDNLKNGSFVKRVQRVIRKDASGKFVEVRLKIRHKFLLLVCQ